MHLRHYIFYVVVDVLVVDVADVLVELVDSVSLQIVQFFDASFNEQALHVIEVLSL